MSWPYSRLEGALAAKGVSIGMGAACGREPMKTIAGLFGDQTSSGTSHVPTTC